MLLLGHVCIAPRILVGVAPAFDTGLVSGEECSSDMQRCVAVGSAVDAPHRAPCFCIYPCDLPRWKHESDGSMMQSDGSMLGP